jgi:hypothetical protein
MTWHATSCCASWRSTFSFGRVRTGSEDVECLSGCLDQHNTCVIIVAEGANLRHMPEVLWFLYWCHVHSAPFAHLCEREGATAVSTMAFNPGVRHAPGATLRDWRVHCRSTYQVRVA